MHWQRTSKEKSQSNLLPTVRELLEAKRRCSNGSNVVQGASKVSPQQTDDFAFPNSGADFGSAFLPSYPSWHTDVSQCMLLPEPSGYGMSGEMPPGEAMSPARMYEPYTFTAPGGDSLAVFPEQQAPYTPLVPGPNLLPLETPCPGLPHWVGSGACAQQDEPPPVTYYPSEPAGRPPLPPRPLGGPRLEEARLTVQQMEVSKLLESDHDGDTVLHIYAAKGMREFAFAAAEKICGLKGLETREHKGKTPLLVAVTANQPDIVYDLIELGADIRAADLKGQTALHLAATEGYPQILQAIQWTGIQVNVEARDYEGFTPLHCAVKSHNASMRKQRDVQRFGGEDCTDLQDRAQDVLQCIILLLNMGASIFTQDVKSSMSVLHQAVQEANLVLVQFFLQLPNPRLQDFLNMKAHGNTALHMAAGLQGDANQERIIRLLLGHGADPGIRNLENEQPGHLLPGGPQGEQMKLLLKRGRPASSTNHRAGSS
ncbi:NF-kappa-B inhibitor delta [Pristis pectinata]|uniref:NF-kappa-B inhibitor delta n=1 Tax=Pristis pectinata TaxID=685728 RepID=UPI00223E7189|nr:NF-kappa-B inhibitor delta [Pristis pectinata]